MATVDIGVQDRVGCLTLNRGKVNALNGDVVEELQEALVAFAADPDIAAVVLTGRGKFFSFGFDIPEFLAYSREEFTDYLVAFTALYTDMFTYPKPIVAALNGHTIAGGYMLALACDHRVMVGENAKISLNEISFGSSVFAGSTEMLRFWVGSRNATDVLYSGAMYFAEEAKAIGLVDEVTADEALLSTATEKARELGSKYDSAFSSIKHLLREPTVARMRSGEQASIEAFVDIWYSDFTWNNLKQITIR